MSRVKCFIEDCRFNNNMRCNAPKVSFKLRSNHPGHRTDRALCEHYRPIP
ncbi:DUF1540 domain-containing protein [Desulfallas thermosapovorans]|uniref:Uncharacterized protein DUF1540 n=1 Tax=Desulfallas thermosapovorans DSM 6562 TaxID=1121431 RepID=A0A5S4ZS18_9FIRM|nr:uncharacterized protein DUF1540 [Desulfallas thermosapovorans DSM 6562]